MLSAAVYISAYLNYTHNTVSIVTDIQNCNQQFNVKAVQNVNQYCKKIYVSSNIPYRFKKQLNTMNS